MTGSMCLVEIDGSPMPADLVPLLVSALVEDSQRLPDMFSLRFRDPERIVLSKSNAKVGGKITIKVNTAASSSPKTLIEAEITALELEFDTGGTFTVIRGYDPAHRLFRDRRTVSYVQMTASDIATQVAKRAESQGGQGGQHQHRLPRGQPGRAERLGDLDPAGARHRLGSDRPQRRVLVRRAGERPPDPPPR